jgi:hypothetical protein
MQFVTAGDSGDANNSTTGYDQRCHRQISADF